MVSEYNEIIDNFTESLSVTVKLYNSPVLI